MEPSDCFCSAMKKDRDVVTGMRPAETELWSNNYTSMHVQDCRTRGRDREKNNLTFNQLSS